MRERVMAQQSDYLCAGGRSALAGSGSSATSFGGDGDAIHTGGEVDDVLVVVLLAIEARRPHRQEQLERLATVHRKVRGDFGEVLSDVADAQRTVHLLLRRERCQPTDQRDDPRRSRAVHAHHSTGQRTRRGDTKPDNPARDDPAVRLEACVPVRAWKRVPQDRCPSRRYAQEIES